ncbi:MAG: UxaA family hydrolase [Planctomycetes bacterium]|nr:UxaA family hydrolase [Planctomycetota bacterium]
MRRFTKMHDDDDVATAMESVEKGAEAAVFDKGGQMLQDITVLEPIPHGNKIALRDIPAGQPIRKYGEVIGESTSPISAGRLVHVHNVRSLKLDVPDSIRREIIRQMNIDTTTEGRA